MEEDSTLFHPKNHADKVLSKLKDCYNTETLVDVVLKAGSHRIPAHK